MASKDLKPKTRLGKSHPGRVKAVVWTIILLAFAGGGYAAYRYTGTTEVEVPVARVRRADFVVSVRTRGDIKSARSTIVKAPQVPGLRITKIAPNGRPISKGDVVVEFDGVSQEQMVIFRTTNLQAVEGEIVQLKATQKMNDEQDAMTKMQSEYALERAKLDASKAEVLSATKARRTASRWASTRASCSRSRPPSTRTSWGRKPTLAASLSARTKRRATSPPRSAT
jgi:multidrug efflux pump subunit AcrA (membrane-fusion protein)